MWAVTSNIFRFVHDRDPSAAVAAAPGAEAAAAPPAPEAPAAEEPAEAEAPAPAPEAEPEAEPAPAPAPAPAEPAPEPAPEPAAEPAAPEPAPGPARPMSWADKIKVTGDAAPAADAPAEPKAAPAARAAAGWGAAAANGAPAAAPAAAAAGAPRPRAPRPADEDRHSRHTMSDDPALGVYIRGMPEAVTESEVRDALSVYGAVTVKMVFKQPGSCLATFKDPAAADAAKDGGIHVLGHHVEVQERRPREPKAGPREGGPRIGRASCRERV